MRFSALIFVLIFKVVVRIFKGVTTGIPTSTTMYTQVSTTQSQWVATSPAVYRSMQVYLLVLLYQYYRLTSPTPSQIDRALVDDVDVGPVVVQVVLVDADVVAVDVAVVVDLVDVVQVQLLSIDRCKSSY